MPFYHIIWYMCTFFTKLQMKPNILTLFEWKIYILSSFVNWSESHSKAGLTDVSYAHWLVFTFCDHKHFHYIASITSKAIVCNNNLLYLRFIYAVIKFGYRYSVWNLSRGKANIVLNDNFWDKMITFNSCRLIYIIT